jgi:hypothetical protein
MADAVESGALAGDTPGRRVCQRSAWRLLLEHVRPYRWMILGGDSSGSWGTGVARRADGRQAGRRHPGPAPVPGWAGRASRRSDHRRGPAQHGPPGIRRFGTAGRPHEAIGAVSCRLVCDTALDGRGGARTGPSGPVTLASDSAVSWPDYAGCRWRWCRSRRGGGFLAVWPVGRRFRPPLAYWAAREGEGSSGDVADGQ